MPTKRPHMMTPNDFVQLYNWGQYLLPIIEQDRENQVRNFLNLKIDIQRLVLSI